jgi:hypothetical protein
VDSAAFDEFLGSDSGFAEMKLVVAVNCAVDQEPPMSEPVIVGSDDVKEVMGSFSKSSEKMTAAFNVFVRHTLETIAVKATEHRSRLISPSLLVRPIV